MHTDVATISDVDFHRMIYMRIYSVAQTIGRSKLSPEEEQQLVEMMTSKATIETHAEQLAGAWEDISLMSSDPENVVEDRIRRVKMAFAVNPDLSDDEDEDCCA